jgi:4-hydroxybenzoate polyprenyltransferase
MDLQSNLEHHALYPSYSKGVSPSTSTASFFIILQKACGTNSTKMNGMKTIWSHIVTLFLFTKSDFKTVVLPQTICALSIALSSRGPSQECRLEPQDVAIRMPCVIAWIWIHLLVENLANQRLPESIDEDKVNKPWRPIPAGRLTPADAQTWLQVAVPVALIISILFNSLPSSTALMTMIWLYNDLDGSSRGPGQRNCLNAAGLACFSWGAVTVLLGSCVERDLVAKWIMLLSLVVATTVHVQDLPDMAGDYARDRKTFPLVYGELVARWSAAILAPCLSLACTFFWSTSVFLGLIPLGISVSMSTVIVLRKSQPLDEIGWKLWCLWAVSLYSLPLLGNSV